MTIKISDYVYQIGNTLFFANPQTNETVSVKSGARIEIGDSAESMNGDHKYRVTVSADGRQLMAWQFADREDAQRLMANLEGLKTREANRAGWMKAIGIIGKKTVFGTACVLAAYVFLIGLSTIFTDMVRPDSGAMAYHSGPPPAEPLPPPEDYAAMILEQMRGESGASAPDNMLSGGSVCPP